MSESIIIPGTKFILSENKHLSSVKVFRNYFNIKTALSGIPLLEEILHHFSHFPYENLSKIIKYQHHFDGVEKLRLPEEVMNDHVSDRLGGTCFSLTFFLQIILLESGFSCYPVMGDMHWGKNVHCALIVKIQERKYLVDPGYLLYHPMELNETKPVMHKSTVEGIRLEFHPHTLTVDLFTFDSKETKWRYRFEDTPVSSEQFLQYWIDSFRWNSMHGLCLTKVEKDRMIYIRKTHMRESAFGECKKYNIKHAVQTTIQNKFGIAPDIVDEALDAVDANMARERELGLWTPEKKNRIQR